MTSAKEVRTQISSIQKTQKITRAMEMVSASKVRKAQDRMLSSRPYAEQILSVIDHLSEAHTEYRHKYLVKGLSNRVGVIVISTDRGLCGSLNANLFKTLTKQMQTWQAQGSEVDICVMGNKADRFFRRFGGNVLASSGDIGDTPEVKDIIGIARVMLDAYDNEKIGSLYIAYNDFVTTMSQKPVIKQLLPIVPSVEEQQSYQWDYVYEPHDAKELLDFLLTRYMESQMYQAMVENIASEHAARMVAMKSATDNAGQLIDELKLIYNKARQASITKELSEIVAGAEAV
jgi:F-type H+-transporting ATPase subunit gamma